MLRVCGGEVMLFGRYFGLWLIPPPLWLISSPLWLIPPLLWLISPPLWLIPPPLWLIPPPLWLISPPLWLIPPPLWLISPPLWLISSPLWLIPPPLWLIYHNYGLYLPHLLHYNLMDQITTPSLLPIKKRSVHKKDRPQPPLHIILTPTPSTHPFP
jgi:hypothetical protein